MNAQGYQVTLRENATGEERTVDFDEPWDDVAEFMWADGNYGCDCNRELFFRRAGGEDPEWDSTECGEERYSVVAIRANGMVVYSEVSSPEPDGLLGGVCL